MRADLPNQFFHYYSLNKSSLNKGSHEDGMTIIELMVVLMIAGLLAAIALPSFLDQVNNARHAEAQTYVGSINRSQQAYFLEYSVFANLTQLSLGVSDSKNYTYTSTPVNSGTPAALTVASPVGVARGYAGKVWLGVGNDGNTTALSIVCAGGAGIVPPISGTTCP